MSQKDYSTTGSEPGGKGAGMPDHTQPSGQVAAGTATEDTQLMEERSGGTATMTKSRADSGRSTTEMAKDRAGEAKEMAGDRMAEAKEMATEKAGQAKEMAADYAEMGKDRAVEGLETAASQVRDRFGEEGMQGQVGTKVADGLEKTATYLREHEAGEMWSEIETFVKDHPMQAAAGALVAGFLMGRVLR